MTRLFNIAFKGEVAEGFSADAVRDLFTQRFPDNQDVVDHLFSGASVTIAKNMDWDRACAAAGKLRSIGAVVYLLNEEGDLVQRDHIESANDPLAASGSFIGQHPDDVQLSDEDETGEYEAATDEAAADEIPAEESAEDCIEKRTNDDNTDP